MRRFLPYAADRFSAAAMFNPGTTPESIQAGLRKFYFDTALSASPTSLPSLLAFAEPGHILYGSDFPYAHPDWSARFDHSWPPTTAPAPNGLASCAAPPLRDSFPLGEVAREAVETHTEWAHRPEALPSEALTGMPTASENSSNMERLTHAARTLLLV